MKKLFVIVLLALCSFASAMDPRNDQASSEQKTYRNAFFMRATSGMSYVNLHEDNSRFYQGIDNDFSGLTTYELNLSLGISFRRFWALYAGASLALGDGDWSGEGTHGTPTSAEVTLEEAYFDLGVLFYPFRKNSVANGICFGVSPSFGIEYATVDENVEDGLHDVINMLYFGIKVEAGYLWDVARHISIGVVAHYKYRLGGDLDSQGMSVGLAFTAMRR